MLYVLKSQYYKYKSSQRFFNFLQICLKTNISNLGKMNATNSYFAHGRCALRRARRDSINKLRQTEPLRWETGPLPKRVEQEEKRKEPFAKKKDRREKKDRPAGCADAADSNSIRRAVNATPASIAAARSLNPKSERPSAPSWHVKTKPAGRHKFDLKRWSGSNPRCSFFIWSFGFQSDDLAIAPVRFLTLSTWRNPISFTCPLPELPAWRHIHCQIKSRSCEKCGAVHSNCIFCSFYIKIGACKGSKQAK